jgi:hypothetical protein
MKQKGLAIPAMAFFVMACGTIAGAQVVNSCDQWANYCSGSYCVYNNIWGQVSGSSQCMVAQSTTQWYVDANHPATSGVKSYPNSSYENVGQPISSLSSLTSSMNTSGPGTGDYCAAWDIWAPTEIMIWINKYGNVAPWGSFVETATIGGVTWDVYKNGYPGFLTRSNSNSMTCDIKSILDYCVSKGWLSAGNTVGKVQGGFEISGTGGVSRRFTMNSYSVSFSTGGTNTTAPTTAPTNPPTSAPTVPPTAPPGNKGDVNNSGSIDIVDALLIAQYYVGLNPSNFNSGLADVNCSGGIDIVDALLIAQLYVGLINSFPC